MKINSSGAPNYYAPYQSKRNGTVSRFAPNAPAEVKQAYVEAAMETGYSEETHMDYISQLLVQQVENRQNGVTNYTDVFGDSTASALRTAKELLYDLEHPLTPFAQRGENAARYIEQEIEFYRAFIEKLEGVEASDNSKTSESSKLEIWHQGKTLEAWSGTDPKYTDSETGISWYVRDGKYPYMTGEDAEKFNRLCKEQGVFPLKKFAEMTGLIQEFDDGTTVYAGDNGIAVKSENGEELWMDTSSLTYGTIMNILKDLPEHGNYADILEERINEIFVKVKNGDTEAIRAIMREEQEKKEEEEEQKRAQLLTAETTTCIYETANPKDEDLRYITWYTEDGIFCRKAGQTGEYEWTIAFENKEQYEKVMEFIGQFPSDWNMRFAAHENFWKDFLNDEIDMDGFMEFIHGTNKGVPDFSIVKGDSVYVDKDKMQWAKYTNPLDARFYTAEEMQRMQAELIAANQAAWKVQMGYPGYE